MKTKRPIFVFGFDPSLTACAMVVIEIRQGRITRLVDKNIIGTDAGCSLPLRLHTISMAVRNFVAKFEAQDALFSSAVESVPQGAKMFSSVNVAKATAACEIGMYPLLVPESYTALAVKRFMVPDWHGISKDNWNRAGYTKAFKRSQPSKIAVASALSTRFDINISNNDLSDAAGIAVYHAHKRGFLNG